MQKVVFVDVRVEIQVSNDLDTKVKLNLDFAQIFVL